MPRVLAWENALFGISPAIWMSEIVNVRLGLEAHASLLHDVVDLHPRGPVGGSAERAYARFPGFSCGTIMNAFLCCYLFSSSFRWTARG